MNVNGELWIGQAAGGQGTLNVDSGTLSVNNWIAVGRQNATGTVTLSGSGVINKTGANHAVIGSLSGVGTVTQTGGSYNSTAASTAGGAGGIRLGENAGGSGLWDISGGNATADFISVGWTGGGSGELRVSGSGVVTAENNVIVGEGGAGTVNLNGGTLRTTTLVAGGSAHQFNFNGGTLKALADNGNFIQGFGSANLSVLAGDGTIDTNGHDVRIQASSSFANPGDTAIDGLAGNVLNKTGLGQLTVEGTAGDGFLAVRVIGGVLDFESNQTLDTLVIEAGATVTLSTLSSPPSPPEAAVLAAGDSLAASSLASSGSGASAVPEPGLLSLLSLGVASLFARRRCSA